MLKLTDAEVTRLRHRAKTMQPMAPSDVLALLDEREALRAALQWALDALGDPPDFTGELAHWERAKAALAHRPEEARDAQ